MIFTKKINKVSILQLAFALSYLYVDQNNYLNRQIQNAEQNVQFEQNRDNSWGLQLLYSVQMDTYYVNQKSIVPLIDDLIYYGRHFETQHNISAYLVNLSTNASSSNNSSILSPVQNRMNYGVPELSNISSNNYTTRECINSVQRTEHEIITVNNSSTVGLINDDNNTISNSLLDRLNIIDTVNPSHPFDIFFYGNNSSNIQDDRSIMEQNLADLNDFNDLPLMDNYVQAILLNNTENENINTARNYSEDYEVDLHLEDCLPNSNNFSLWRTELSAGAINESCPLPDNNIEIKIEYNDNEIDLVINSTDDNISKVKINDFVEDANNLNCHIGDNNNSGIPGHNPSNNCCFLSDVELTKEECDIVEVLWKQDVDLGYSLGPCATGNIETKNSVKTTIYSNSDELGKKKLIHPTQPQKNFTEEKETHEQGLEVRNEDSLDQILNRNAFTIDSETGEYIRLPLEDLLTSLEFVELINETIPIEKNTTDNDVIKEVIPDFESDRTLLESELENTCESDRKASTQNIYVVNNTNISHEASLSTNCNTEIYYISEENSVPSFLFDSNDTDDNQLEKLATMLHTSSSNGSHSIQQPQAQHIYAHHNQLSVNGAAATPSYGSVGSAFHRQNSGSVTVHHVQQPVAYHHHHPQHVHPHVHQSVTPHQNCVALSRGVMMEHHIHDFANLFSPLSGMAVVNNGRAEMTGPYAHYATAQAYPSAATTTPYAVTTHTQTQTIIHANSPHSTMPQYTAFNELCSNQPHYGHNIGSAVSSSMHLTNSSHDGNDFNINFGLGIGMSGMSMNGNSLNILGNNTNVTTSATSKMEHDMLYYQNQVNSVHDHGTHNTSHAITSCSNNDQTNDGVINLFLNDEDVHLMETNVNQNYCSVLDVNPADSVSTSPNVLTSGITDANSHSMQELPVGGQLMVSGQTATNASPTVMAPNVLVRHEGRSASLTQDRHLHQHNASVSGSGADRLDASSDSAVSSMGSERISSLSDGEWCEGSDSTQYPVGSYDFEYNQTIPLAVVDGIRVNNTAHTQQRQHQSHPVAQKKHQMFGKRYPTDYHNGYNQNNTVVGTRSAINTLQRESDLLNAVNQDLVKQNHTYALTGPSCATKNVKQNESSSFHSTSVSSSTTIVKRSAIKQTLVNNQNQMICMGTDNNGGNINRSNEPKASTSNGRRGCTRVNNDLNLTRDEKRARTMNIPITVTDIINLPMDEFNERLSKYDLSEIQLSLIRDIRRRGKNKVAAQNCRKRKLDQILSLEDEVKQVRQRKEQLKIRHEQLLLECNRISEKFCQLHRHIFKYLRDGEGKLCSPSNFSLQQSTDGTIYLLPRDNSTKVNVHRPVNSEMVQMSSIEDTGFQSVETQNQPLEHRHNQSRHHYIYHQQQQQDQNRLYSNLNSPPYQVVLNDEAQMQPRIPFDNNFMDNNNETTTTDENEIRRSRIGNNNTIINGLVGNHTHTHAKR